MYNGDKDNKNMIVVQEKKIARFGFINEVAKACGCSRHTVRTAIYNNAKGVKADKVRKYYMAKYQQPNALK